MRYANDANDNDYNNARMITILERLLFKKRKTLVVKMRKFCFYIFINNFIKKVSK